MTDMTTTSLPVSQWTLLYTAAGAVTITLQNRGAVDLRLRIGAAAVVGDALSAAHDTIYQREIRSITLAAADKVFAAPDNDSTPGKVNIRA